MKPIAVTQKYHYRRAKISLWSLYSRGTEGEDILDTVTLSKFCIQQALEVMVEITIIKQNQLEIAEG